MTAWFSIVAPLCVVVKCCVDFIVLEYGSKFRPMTDQEMITLFAVLGVYTLFVDGVNFFRGRR